MSIICIAKKYIGTPYKFEANGFRPGEKMDCSRFIQLVMNELGINISRITTKQLKQGKEINKNNMIIGDCIYFDYGNGIEDIGLYIGNNKMIHNSPTQGKVIEENINSDKDIKMIRRFSPKYRKGEIILKNRSNVKYIDKSCRFLLYDYNGNGVMDLFCIKNSDDRTAVHILNGANLYQSSLLPVKTVLENYDEKWEFKIGKYEKGKPALFCIKKNNTESKTTEIHILNGDNEYQTFLLRTNTVLQETDDNWDFVVDNYNKSELADVYCIHKKNTQSKKTEIEILVGDGCYQSFLPPKIITALHETDNNWEFLLRDYNKDGNLDLYCINKNGENNSTEVKILSGVSGFQEFILDIKLDLYSIDNFQFCAGAYNGYECIFGIKKNEILEIYAFNI